MNLDIKLTIPNILKAINNSTDFASITNYENKLACMYASPLLFFGAFANFMVRYVLWHGDLLGNAFDSIVFLLLGVAFEFLLRYPLDVKRANYFIAFLYAVWFIFISIRFYDIIGPAVWTIGFIQLMLAMSRVTKVMLIFIGSAFIFVSIYMFFTYKSFLFEWGLIYFLVQTALFALLFVISASVHKINTSRYLKLEEKLKEAIMQKDEITALYEEIAATDEEMSEQNRKLFEYNQALKNNEETLNRLAYFDTLTQLPNRKQFMERLDQSIQVAKAQGSFLYVVFIDLDNFKKVNDTMGHHVGDLVIEAAAKRMAEHIEGDDFLGRLGGDEFALVIFRNICRNDVTNYIEKIRNSLLEPFHIGNAEIRATASFGISEFPQDGDETIKLLQFADTSMYKAKELGKNKILYFHTGMKDELLARLAIESKLVTALSNNEFYLVFQPQYCLTQNKIKGFETLLRWKSAELGTVSPLRFIPVAEETGLIIPLGEWVLKTACSFFKDVQAEYNLDAHVSVNISAIQLKDSGFLQKVCEVLQETGLAPENLELEITESVFIDNIDSAVEILSQLKETGVRIALDDFGTGFSSLSYLRKLPIDTLKIDKSFVDYLSQDIADKEFIGDIISLGHSLKTSIVAEGVENEFQRAYLEKCNCDCIQGYLIGKPMEAGEIVKLIRSAPENFIIKAY